MWRQIVKSLEGTSTNCRCVASNREVTGRNHYELPLRGVKSGSHWKEPLRTAAVWRHIVKSLEGTTTNCRCVASNREVTGRNHYQLPICGVKSSSHWKEPLPTADMWRQIEKSLEGTTTNCRCVVSNREVTGRNHHCVPSLPDFDSSWDLAIQSPR